MDNQIRRRRTHSDQLGERDLAGLINEEIVEPTLCFGPTENPCGAPNKIRQRVPLKYSRIVRDNLNRRMERNAILFPAFGCSEVYAQFRGGFGSGFH
jgi:hypothetical protein